MALPSISSECGAATLKGKPNRPRQNATLKVLRRRAPVQDRGNKALAPGAAPNRYDTNYVPVYLYARTLDELRDKLGEYGDAAAAQARWGAIGVWMMRAEINDPRPKCHPGEIAAIALRVCRSLDTAKLWALRSPPANPVLHDHSPECIREAQLIGAEMAAEWELAGSPHLGPRDIKHTQQLAQSLIAQAKKDNPA